MKITNIELSQIDTVILAGGLGTRLKPILKDKPKCLAPINGKPFIDILIDNYIEQGLKRFIICVGYLKEQIIEYLCHRNDCEIVFSKEDKPLGTGGALKKAQSLIKSDHYIVLNGDSFIEIDIYKYIKWFQLIQNDISIVITKINNSKRYGNVTFDKNGLITSFGKKNNSSLPAKINAGVYLFKKNTIDFSHFSDEFSIETEFFPSLIKRGIKTYYCKGKFIDIGTKNSFQDSQLFFNK